MKLGIKAYVKKAYASVDPITVALYRTLHPAVRSVPPAMNRMRVGNRSIGAFMQAGKNCYIPIKAAIDKHYDANGARPRVLDFGCGVGRVFQYFWDQNIELSGCDVDASAVEYMNRAYFSAKVVKTDYTPPLPFAAEAFDIVYSVSVWTHLPPGLQYAWLSEMRRILRSGGLALLTTIGPYGYRKGTHLQAVRFTLDELLAAGFRYSDYEVKNASPGTGSAYGAAYHTPDYVRANWSKVMQVLEVQEGVIDDLNDLVVMVKD